MAFSHQNVNIITMVFTKGLKMFLYCSESDVSGTNLDDFPRHCWLLFEQLFKMGVLLDEAADGPF